MDSVRKWYLLVVVIVGGAVVMALEILGTRIIGTFYGSSVYVWGALITVTLVSLSVGYYLGGRLADRAPKRWVLYTILFVAGVLTFSLIFTRKLLPPCYKLFGIAGGTLASSFLIFTLPLTLLGVTSPFVIRLIASEVKTVGKTAGSVYALSTIGSVVGTLSVSFFVIPLVGTRLAVSGIAALLVLVAVVGMALERGARYLVLLILMFLVLVGHGSDTGVVYTTESAYSRLTVVDRDAERFLLINGILQTGKPKDLELLGRTFLLRESNYYLELLPYYNPDGTKALLIGLAGGLLPDVLLWYGIETTAVEIDAKVADIARKYFDYQGEVIIQDGRRYVEDTKESFDFCILDAYSSDVLPFHLVTEEMFQAVKRRLNQNGVLGINYIGFPKGEVFGAIYKTVNSVFPHVEAYKTKDDDSIQTIYMFASKSELELLPLWLQDSDVAVDELTYNLEKRKIDAATLSGIVLTDDYNPIDLARAKTSIRWREKSIRMFGYK